MKGLDICSQQGTIDFKTVKNSGIEFVIPRTGRGVNLDNNGMDYRFLEYCREAQKVGIKVPGVYHFIYVHSLDDALKNAKKAVECVQKAGLPKSTIIWCDQEEKTVEEAVEHGFNLTTDPQRRVTEIFCDYILSQGYCTGVYLNMDYIKRVYGKDIVQKYDIWLDDHTNAFPDYSCLYRQTNWHGIISGVNTPVDFDEYVGVYTAGTAKPKQEATKMGLVDKFCEELQKLSDRCIPYYGEGYGGIGCSEYICRALRNAGIIKESESFWAGQGDRGVLKDKSRFQHLDFSPSTIKRGDILYSHWTHVMAWDGKGGCWEGAPVNGHDVCDNGRTGVGHRTGHGYRNCGNGTYSWSDVYRIIDPEEVKQDVKEAIKMDKAFNLKTLVKYLPTIQNGSKGDMVKALQEIMAKYGWYGDAIDGQAGPNTVKGIKLMQTAIGTYVDGIAGPMTWTGLLV